METFSGPLPPPETFARYNDAFPGAAERIMVAAERQAQHRQILEVQVYARKQANERLGQWMAFVIALVGIGGAIWLMDRGKATWGFSVFLTTVGSLVGGFIYGRVRQRRDLEEKAKGFGPKDVRTP